MSGGTPPPGVCTVPLRWWHLPGVMALEQALFGSDAWTVEVFWSELAQGRARWYLVALPSPGGEVLGYVGLADYGQEAYIQTLAVAPAAQGAGLGARLLDQALQEARRRGAQLVGLEVRTDNAVALGMYGRRGFQVVGTRRGYYQPSGADAHIMLLRLPAPG